MSRVNISVVVPFRNEERYIADCITALESQSYPRELYEIIMVDSNSTDRSADIAGRHAGVRVLREPTPGAYAARNRGIAEAGGAIVALTDSDCAPRPDWLERIADALSDPSQQLVQGRARFAAESPGLSDLSDYENEKASFVFASGVREIYYASANNLAVRRSVFDRAGRFTELERGADVIFLHRVIAEYSCDAVRYRSDMVVRHLEVTSVTTWFRKLMVYGRSSRRYGRIAHARPLNGRERLHVFRATIRNVGYPIASRLRLIALLLAGVVYYELGRRLPEKRDD
jgi:glycosyltransferase involved in cell wall biosynthesis